MAIWFKLYGEAREKIVGIVRRSERIKLRINWPIFEFFKEQFEEPLTVSLGSIICINGSGSLAEATTCEEYINRMWPGIGPTVLSSFTEAIHSRFRAFRGQSPCFLILMIWLYCA